jgi:hypothetical protein
MEVFVIGDITIKECFGKGLPKFYDQSKMTSEALEPSRRTN